MEEMLLKQGLRRTTVEKLLEHPSCTEAQIGTAIANADLLGRRGELKSRAGYIRQAIMDNYTPLEGSTSSWKDLL
jgi:hypothetical protein